jgi:hypothetical protein
MENTRNRANNEKPGINDLSKKESEELVLFYLEDYYRTLDDYFLKEALQLAKDEGIDMQKIMQRAKLNLA